MSLPVELKIPATTLCRPSACRAIAAPLVIDRAAPLAAAVVANDNNGMDIVLNGQPRALAAPLSVLELLQAEGLGDRRVAVEVNGEIVPRSRHSEHALAPGDRVEIVHALGGG